MKLAASASSSSFQAGTSPGGERHSTDGSSAAAAGYDSCFRGAADAAPGDGGAGKHSLSTSYSHIIEDIFAHFEWGAAAFTVTDGTDHMHEPSNDADSNSMELVMSVTPPNHTASCSAAASASIVGTASSSSRWVVAASLTSQVLPPASPPSQLVAPASSSSSQSSSSTTVVGGSKPGNAASTSAASSTGSSTIKSSRTRTIVMPVRFVKPICGSFVTAPSKEPKSLCQQQRKPAK